MRLLRFQFLELSRHLLPNRVELLVVRGRQFANFYPYFAKALLDVEAKLFVAIAKFSPERDQGCLYSFSQLLRRLCLFSTGISDGLAHLFPEHFYGTQKFFAQRAGVGTCFFP